MLSNHYQCDLCALKYVHFCFVFYWHVIVINSAPSEENEIPKATYPCVSKRRYSRNRRERLGLTNSQIPFFHCMWGKTILRFYLPLLGEIALVNCAFSHTTTCANTKRWELNLFSLSSIVKRARNHLVPLGLAYYVPRIKGKPILPEGWQPRIRETDVVLETVRHRSCIITKKSAFIILALTDYSGFQYYKN